MMFPYEAVPLYSSFPASFVELDTYANDDEAIGIFEALGAKFLIHLNHLGILPSARSTPTAPEVDKHITASEIAEGKLISIDQLSCKFRCSFPIDILRLEVDMAASVVESDDENDCDVEKISFHMIIDQQM